MDSGFNWLDILIVVGYFVGITGYGLWLTKKVKNSDLLEKFWKYLQTGEIIHHKVDQPKW